jgi:hypothetical protein
MIPPKPPKIPTKPEKIERMKISTSLIASI